MLRRWWNGNTTTKELVPAGLVEDRPGPFLLHAREADLLSMLQARENTNKNKKSLSLQFRPRGAL